MKRCLFTGCGTALITPMTQSGKIDEGEFERLIDWQIEQGADALVVCGTTGESATLTDEEHERLFRRAISTAKKRVPVIAGTGANDTAHAVRRSCMAADCGADGLLLVTPYYNKTTQKGLVEHFKTITNQARLPAIVYNVPSRTGMNIEPRTAKELAENEWICGIKEASGSTAQAVRIAALCGDDLPLYSGNDSDILSMLALGGKGVISVVSNLMPAAAHRLCAAWEQGDFLHARKLQLSLSPLVDALFSEVNPIPIKYAMQRTGWVSGRCRLPLVELSEAKKQAIDELLMRYELI